MLSGWFKALTASAKRPQMLPEPPRPFVVTVVQGGSVETVAFASESSLQRIDGGFSGGSIARLAGQAGGRNTLRFPIKTLSVVPREVPDADDERPQGDYPVE